MLPTLSANASLVSNDGDNAGTDHFDQTVGFRASVPLFRGFSGINGMRQAQAERDAASHAYDSAFNGAIVRLVSAIAAVNRDSQIVDARQQELQSLNAFLRESRQRQASGIISGAEIEQIRVQVTEVEAELARSQGALRSSQARRNSLLGEIGIASIDIQQITPFLPRNEQEAVQIAVAESPVLQEAGLRAEASRRGIHVAAGSWSPTADFSIVGEHSDSSTTTNTDDLDLQFRLDVQVPLFDGGQRLADIRQSQSVHRELSHRLRAAHRDLIANTQSAWARHEAAGQVVRLSNDRLAAARRALSAIREARRIGARTTSDELSARRDALNASVAVAEAQMEQIEASHQLLLVIGRVNLAYSVIN